MKVETFGKILPKLGLTQAVRRAGTERWQLWEGIEEHTFGQEPVQVLYLATGVIWPLVPNILEQAKRFISPNGRFFVIIQNGAEPAADLPKLAKLCRAKAAYTTREVLNRAITRTLGAGKTEDGENQLFVEPDSKAVNHRGEVLRRGDPQKAVQTLSSWLTNDRDGGPRIAVLIAKAGVGKTTVARELFRRLRARTSAGRFPILVESDQWAKLSSRENLGLWDVWRESLDVLYASTISRDDLEMCVENGLFLPIFDGFDELCTRLGGHFTPGDTLDRLMELVSDTDGRILITTRDAFWMDNLAEERRKEVVHFELLGFNKQQKDKFLENRFRVPAEIYKREVANKILQRIGNIAYGEKMPEYRERLTSVPLLVVLAAECADIEATEASVLKYGALLDSGDPLSGVLMILFERERERRQIPLSAADQFALFNDLAISCGEIFSRHDLNWFATQRCDSQLKDSHRKALESHALLKNIGDQFTFRFDFLHSYLAAHALIDRMLVKSTDPQAHRLLEAESRGGSILIERAVDYLRAQTLDALDKLKPIWTQADFAGKAQSGMFHLILAAAERESGSGPREQRTTSVANVISSGSPIWKNLNIEGIVTGLDLRGITFESCTFSNAGFSKCMFDSSSRFKMCKLEGTFEIEDCEGFSSVPLEACDVEPLAREAIQSQKSTLPVTHSQLRWAIRSALETFQRGLGFKAIDRASWKRGRIAKSPIGGTVWEALERFGVIQAITLPGLLEDGLTIADLKKGEVQIYLSNSILTGSLKDAYAFLCDRLEIEPDKKRS